MPDSLIELAEASSSARPADDCLAPTILDFASGIYGLSGTVGDWPAKNLAAFIANAARLADISAILSAAALSYLLRRETINDPPTYFLEVVVAVLLSVIFFERVGAYNLVKMRSLRRSLSQQIISFCGIASTLIVIDYLLKISDQISRVWSLVWFASALALIVIVRLAVWKILNSFHRAGKLANPIAVIGSRQCTQRLIMRLAPELGRTVKVIGLFDVEDDVKSVVERLARISRIHPIAEVFIPLPWTNAVSLESLLRPLRNLPLEVKLLPEIPDTNFSCLSFSNRCGMPAISVVEEPLTGFQVAVKRMEDIVLSAFILLLAAPPMALIAILIKIDSPGPAFFRQQRWGFNARQISVLKFRTMRPEAAHDPAAPQATRNDARVTRLGKILRRTSLDELPQLINVLRGEMSLVGPRPHAVAHNEQYVALIDDYLGRHRVKPGITGLAQVNGCRGITDTVDKMQRRVNYDLKYIDEWSLFLDFKVLIQTAFVGFFHKNAF